MQEIADGPGVGGKVNGLKWHTEDTGPKEVY